ncbi:MAG: hypothetical protein V3W41_17540 [Planctomycetota bacterium]
MSIKLIFSGALMVLALAALAPSLSAQHLDVHFGGDGGGFGISIGSDHSYYDGGHRYHRSYHRSSHRYQRHYGHRSYRRSYQRGYGQRSYRRSYQRGYRNYRRSYRSSYRSGCRY